MNMKQANFGLLPEYVVKDVKHAEGFIDRLAIYKDEASKYFKVICRKRPSDRTITRLSRHIQKWDYRTYLQVEYPSGSMSLSFQPLFDQIKAS